MLWQDRPTAYPKPFESSARERSACTASLSEIVGATSVVLKGIPGVKDGAQLTASSEVSRTSRRGSGGYIYIRRM